MKRILIIYSVLIAIFSAVVFLVLARRSESFIEYWHWTNPERGNLPGVTECAPLAARLGWIASVGLISMALASLRSSHHREKVLIHAMALTALIQMMLVLFIVVAGTVPSIITIQGLAPR